MPVLIVRCQECDVYQLVLTFEGLDDLIVAWVVYADGFAKYASWRYIHVGLEIRNRMQ